MSFGGRMGGLHRMYRGHRRNRRHGGGGGIDPYMIMLALQLVGQVLDMPNKPMVSVVISLVLAAFYIKPGPLEDLVPNNALACISPTDPTPIGFFWSPFLHGSEWHLFHNVSSLIWKGASMEPSMGIDGYIKLLCVSLVLSQVIHIVLGSLLNDHGCAVGFSGILFALKVVHNHTNPGGQTSYYGLRIANKYASWAELVIIQLIYPNASFLGHLSGIIAGFIYIQVVHPNLSVFNRSVSFVRTKLYNLVAKLNSRGSAQSTSSRGTYGSGRSGKQKMYSPEPRHNDDYDPKARSEEGYSDISEDTSGTKTYYEPRMDELRRRRLQKYGQ